MPMVMSQSAALAGAMAPSAKAVSAVVRSVVFFISIPLSCCLAGSLPADGSGRFVERLSGGSLVEVVFHDRAMAAGSVTLQRIDIAGERLCRSQHSVNARHVTGRQRDVGYRKVGGEMGAVARPDDYASYSRAPQHGSTRHRRHVGLVAIGDVPQSLEQRLEQVPAAEVVDDELVFDERAVFQRLLGLGNAKPTV